MGFGLAEILIWTLPGWLFAFVIAVVLADAVVFGLAQPSRTSSAAP